MRALLQKLTGWMALTRSIQVGGRKVPIVVSPGARLGYLKPGPAHFDVELVQVAEARIKPGMNVWDIGANVGVFSVAAAAMGARALAVEADIWLASLLRRTAALHEDRIKVVPTAVSDECGVVEFNIAEIGRAANAIAGQGRHADRAALRVETVPTLTLDTLLRSEPAPDLIKIDVEGAEMLVLAGASAVLEQGPMLFIEVEAGNRPAMQKLLEPMGYRAHRADGTPCGFDEGRDILYIRAAT